MVGNSYLAYPYRVGITEVFSGPADSVVWLEFSGHAADIGLQPPAAGAARVRWIIQDCMARAAVFFVSYYSQRSYERKVAAGDGDERLSSLTIRTY